jgi:hypothetical protein
LNPRRLSLNRQLRPQNRFPSRILTASELHPTATMTKIACLLSLLALLVLTVAGPTGALGRSLGQVCYVDEEGFAATKRHRGSFDQVQRLAHPSEFLALPSLSISRSLLQLRGHGATVSNKVDRRLAHSGDGGNDAGTEKDHDNGGMDKDEDESGEPNGEGNDGSKDEGSGKDTKGEGDRLMTDSRQGSKDRGKKTEKDKDGDETGTKSSKKGSKDEGSGKDTKDNGGRRLADAGEGKQKDKGKETDKDKGGADKGSKKSSKKGSKDKGTEHEGSG